MELTTKSRISPSLSYVNRSDPIHEIPWQSLYSIEFHKPSMFKYQFTNNSEGYLVQKKREVYSPIRIPDSALYTSRAIRIMSLLVHFDVLTTRQIASFLGEPSLNTLTNLYLAGIVQRAEPKWNNNDHKSKGEGAIWRTSRSSQDWELYNWAAKLTDLEYHLVFHGIDPYYIVPGTTARTSIRHNLACAEIALRALEQIPSVIGFFGEVFCDGETLFPDHEENPLIHKKMLDTSADFSLVTKSGHTIFFEVAAGKGVANKIASIGNKAANWAQIIAQSDIPMSVVFLDASNNGHGQHRALMRAINYGLTERLPEFMPNSSVVEEVSQHIFAASTMDWFPLSRSVSDMFSTLQATQPSVDLDDRVDVIKGEDNMVNLDADHVFSTLSSLATPPWVTRRVREFERV